MEPHFVREFVVKVIDDVDEKVDNERLCNNIVGDSVE